MNVKIRNAQFFFEIWTYDHVWVREGLYLLSQCINTLFTQVKIELL